MDEIDDPLPGPGLGLVPEPEAARGDARLGRDASHLAEDQTGAPECAGSQMGVCASQKSGNGLACKPDKRWAESYIDVRSPRRLRRPMVSLSVDQPILGRLLMSEKANGRKTKSDDLTKILRMRYEPLLDY